VVARGCLAAGCPSLALKSGYCVRHQVPILAERARVRRIYATPHHKTWRALILARDPVCKTCGYRPSVIADHIIPLRYGGTWALSNGRGLCRHCDGVLGAAQRFQRAS
jgi:5-methylcytosine-specific restriction endonuclease McrA